MVDKKQGSRAPSNPTAGRPAVGSAVVSVVRPQLSRRRKKQLLLISALVVLVLAGTAAWWFGRSEKEPVPYEQASDDARYQSIHRDYGDAINSLEKYLANEPADKRQSKEHYEAVLSLGKAYYDAKRYDEAIARYEQLLDSGEYKLDGQRGLGKSYAAKGDKVKARQYLEAVVATMKTRTDPESQFRITMDEAELNAVMQ